MYLEMLKLVARTAASLHVGRKYDMPCGVVRSLETQAQKQNEE